MIPPLSVLAWIIAAAFFLLGLSGLIVPIIPDAPLLLVGMVLYGLIAGFEPFGWTFWVGELLLVGVAVGVDALAAAVGTRRWGGSSRTMWGAVIGLIAGPFLFGPLGVVAGPFVGATLTALFEGKQAAAALKVGVGAFVGFLGGVVGKLFLQLIMIGWFVWTVVGR